MKKRILIALFLLPVLFGCSKLTMDNYNKIAVGMHYDDVVQLIGKPDKCDDMMGFRSCTWGDASRSIDVKFAGDQVVLFSSNNLK